MNLTPESFLKLLHEGKTEKELNFNETVFTSNQLWEDRPRKNPANLNYLVKYCGHTLESGSDHLNTDYSNGFTICDTCGSYFHLGKGFTKHLSHGCLNCEGDKKHTSYEVGQSHVRSLGGFPARTMCVMFDDGMHYTKDKLEKEKFFHLLPLSA